MEKGKMNAKALERMEKNNKGNNVRLAFVPEPN